MSQKLRCLGPCLADSSLVIAVLPTANPTGGAARWLA
ncbi:unnamed protein product [Protopolystoma xenopodis]|uniref:Uncharacterized protein n=1 Tax=Protopolystoma xenopodis TaxID=117903 RepID=A0A448X2A7_9PLAT|nr:unnamed protein product [Protopolystoma xenopodis]